MCEDSKQLQNSVAAVAVWMCSCSVFPLQLGSTAIGVLTNEGVVLAVEKRVTSPLLVSAA